MHAHTSQFETGFLRMRVRNLTILSMLLLNKVCICRRGIIIVVRRFTTSCPPWARLYSSTHVWSILSPSTSSSAARLIRTGVAVSSWCSEGSKRSFDSSHAFIRSTVVYPKSNNANMFLEECTSRVYVKTLQVSDPTLTKV